MNIPKVMRFTVKFDLVQNIEEQIKFATDEELKQYEENKEKLIKEFIEKFKAELKEKLDFKDYRWIENIEVKKKMNRVNLKNKKSPHSREAR